MRRHKTLHNSNKIDVMKKRMDENQYNPDLQDDDYFFFNIQSNLGSGTKDNPVRIMMTSPGLMENIRYLGF